MLSKDFQATSKDCENAITAFRERIYSLSASVHQLEQLLYSVCTTLNEDERTEDFQKIRAFLRKNFSFAGLLVTYGEHKRREGALEALRGLPVPRTVDREIADKHRLGPLWAAHLDGRAEYYREHVLTAIAALDAEEAQNG